MHAKMIRLGLAALLLDRPPISEGSGSICLIQLSAWSNSAS